MLDIDKLSRQTVKEKLNEDMVWFNQSRREKIIVKDHTVMQLVYKAIVSKRFRMYFYIRIMHLLYKKRHNILCRIIGNRIFKVHGLEVSPKAIIGGGLQLGHPQGVIIGGDSVIGRFVQIGQHCTIGSNTGKVGDCGRKFPIICDYTRIFAGAVVVGPIRIGKSSIVGPNSVVIRDVPDRCVVSGIPAKKIKEHEGVDADEKM